MAGPMIDWQLDCRKAYPRQCDLLFVGRPGSSVQVLPQVVVLGARALRSTFLRELDGDTIPGPAKSAGRGALAPSSDAVSQGRPVLFRPPVVLPAALDVVRPRPGPLAARLTALISDGESKLVMQPCTYEDYVCTNLALDAEIDGERALLRRLAGPNGRLTSLASSPLANPLGINTLVVTVDQHMILQRRAEAGLSIRCGQLCSGGSGGVDWTHVVEMIAKGGRLEGKALLHEIGEEINVDASEVSEHRLLGLTRELVRGGKPELFCLAHVSVSAQDVLARNDHSPEGEVIALPVVPFLALAGSGVRSRLPSNTSLLTEFWSMVAAMARIAEVSLPLMTNLTLWLWAVDRSVAGVTAPGPP